MDSSDPPTSAFQIAETVGVHYRPWLMPPDSHAYGRLNSIGLRVIATPSLECHLSHSKLIPSRSYQVAVAQHLFFLSLSQLGALWCDMECFQR